jgi:uncharacterized coiled-coil protein SlyX
MKTIITPRGSLFSILRSRSASILITLALGTLAIGQRAEAVTPAPDGGYAGGNTAEGQNALLSLTSGAFNTAVGFLSLRSNITGQLNTAIGAGTLLANTADDNTGTGAGALLSNTTGTDNTANGSFALFSNTTASENTGVGAFTLQNNTTGGTPGGSGITEVGPNTAIGGEALFSNTTGGANTAVGFQALHAISDKSQSTAVGFKALANSINNNDAFGYKALGNNTTGFLNTAIGDLALSNNTTGTFNVALGAVAGVTATTGSNNIYIGFGINGVAGESGACYIGSIFNATAAGGTPVFINSSGKLGTLTSSARFKEEIKPMDTASEALFSLKPVTFRYKTNIDPAGTSQFGLVAEEVQKVNPDLVVRDKEGKPYSVRYDQVNAMLLNEFLKQHRKLQELEANDAEQQREIKALVATVKEQASQIQKVSAQVAAASPSHRGLRTSKFATRRIRAGGPAPQLVNNP